MSFLFTTAIGTSYPNDADGRRLDAMDRSGHYARWEEDFELARELGVQALSYGPAYYRTHVAPDGYDWEPCVEPLERLRDLGIAPIADLCHHGVPNWLGGFQDAAFPVLFAEYARAFARRFPWVRHYTPVHSILTSATNSGLLGLWNERGTSDATFVQAMRNLCMAHELAVEAILSERPDATIVQIESAAHYESAGREAQHEAERWNVLRFLPLDLTLGREPAPGLMGYLHAHGVASNDLAFFRERRGAGRRWLGLEYHPWSERRVSSSGRTTASGTRLGFWRLGAEYWQRYRVPLVHAGTRHRVKESVAWLRDQWEDVTGLRSAGVPVRGFGWSPLVDAPAPADGTPDEVRIGLFATTREERAVATEFAGLVKRWTPLLSRDEVEVRGERRRS